MVAEGAGYFTATVSNVESNAKYMYRIDDATDRPDPASRSQPDGVHGPSRVIDLSYPWNDAVWRGVPLWEYVIYELHVGTFSRAGDFSGVAGEIARLRELGITAIELMPVAQFPGSRNWGYDGVHPFAVQDSYGGATGLQRLVDECHRAGMAVILDVVYNHLGPEGNYLAAFGPYFTDRYKTPWGQAVNFDGPFSGEVREYFIQNALQWVDDFHVDALRLDAVHAIYDRSATSVLEELAEVVHRRAETLGRHVYLIAESDLNDPRLVQSSDVGGHGLDAMWCDDYHHAAHVLLTGEREGYYQDFGSVADMANAFRGAMSRPRAYSEFRKRVHGRAAIDLRPERAVVCIQNHDQVGNRMRGERFGTLLSFEQQKLAAGVVCLAPFVPMLFMGEEYGETAPFLYWVSHGDPELLEAVRRGRREEFAAFGTSDVALDPADPETFERSKLDHALRHSGRHAILYRLYGALIAQRAKLAAGGRWETVAFEAARVLLATNRAVWIVFNFAGVAQDVRLPVACGTWVRALSTADVEWGGSGEPQPAVCESNGEVSSVLQPHSVALYSRAERVR